MYSEITVHFQSVAKAKKKPFYVKDLQISEIGFVDENTDDDDEEIQYYIRVAPSIVINLNGMRVARPGELDEECEKLPTGTLHLNIVYES
jgi:hypothetical protein